jgi:hypothetical protein
VAVEPGATAVAALASGGRGAVLGRALELGTRAPVPGLTCAIALEPLADSGVRPWGPEHGSARTDGQGRFQLSPVPAGPVELRCRGPAVGSARVVVPREGRAEVEVAVVRRRGAAASACALGVDLIEGPGGFLITRLEAGGDADRAGLRAGDLLTAIGGVPAAGLGVASFVALAAAGASDGVVAVSVSRAGHADTLSLRVSPDD